MSHSSKNSSTNDDKVIKISPAFRGYFTASDLLGAERTLVFQLYLNEIRQIDGALFHLADQNFKFTLSVKNETFILQRCQDVVRLKPDLSFQPNFRVIFITWTPTKLLISSGSQDGEQVQEISTPPMFPPVSLIRFAPHKKLLPTHTFPSVEALRDAVYEALTNLQEDIQRQGAYNAFWDQTYQDKRKQRPKPKKETDIHPTLHILLSEWALIRSIEIIPENKTGGGNLDLSFVGFVDGVGPMSICVEVKRAHARDLLHGLVAQLPNYMYRKQAQYGAYIVLWFRGEWFPYPSIADIKRMGRTGTDDSLDASDRALHSLEFVLVNKTLVDPTLNGIRVFILDVTKPISASKL